MMKKVIKVVGLTICGFLAIIGLIGLVMGLGSESLFPLMIGTFILALYYFFIKEDSKGGELFIKLLSNKLAGRILFLLFVISILGRLFIASR